MDDAHGGGLDFRDDRVGSALAGANPTVLRRLSAGFAVIGDDAHLLGPAHDDLRAALGAEIDRQRAS